MQITVSVAVVLVALSVAVAGSAEEAETEPTLSQKFEQFQQDMQTFIDHFGEKTKTVIHNFQHSDFSNKTRNWFSDNFQKLKAKWKEAFTNPGSD